MTNQYVPLATLERDPEKDYLEFVKVIVDTLHDNFGVTEVKIDNVVYRWPIIFHDKNCR